MKVLFFGTPDIAVPFLEKLFLETEVVGLLTRPDEPSGRGHDIHAPPTKAFAETRGIRVFQPKRWDDELLLGLSGLNADLGVVVAYGKIIPPQIFTLPRYRTLNVHFSLLPRYRGAAPIQWALMRGERETGVTAFWIDEDMDTGPILAQRGLAIPPQTGTPALKKLLIPLGLDVLSESLELIRKGELKGKPQEGTPSFAPPIRKEHGRVDWSKPAREIEALVRALVEWPEGHTQFATGPFQGQVLKVLEAAGSDVCPGEAGICPPGAVPGEITGIVKGRGFVIKCGEGFLSVFGVQAEGRKPMSAWAFWQGARMKVGDRFC